jgi:carbon starvation protein CstA
MKITELAHIFVSVKVVCSDPEMGWATFWANFSHANLVTLTMWQTAVPNFRCRKSVFVVNVPFCIVAIAVSILPFRRSIFRHLGKESLFNFM